MALTKIFTYQQPHEFEDRQKILDRQKTLLEGFSVTLGQGDEAVLRVLNEYGEIGQLERGFHAPEDCRSLYDALKGAGYEENVQLGEYFNAKDSGQIAVYLIGQAMVDLKEGQPPPGIFVVRSSLALNGVEPSEWQHVINREIIMV